MHLCETFAYGSVWDKVLPEVPHQQSLKLVINKYEHKPHCTGSLFFVFFLKKFIEKWPLLIIFCHISFDEKINLPEKNLLQPVLHMSIVNAAMFNAYFKGDTLESCKMHRMFFNRNGKILI